MVLQMELLGFSKAYVSIPVIRSIHLAAFPTDRHPDEELPRELYPASVFYTPLFSQRSEFVGECVQWASERTDSKQLHLYAFPFLFPPSARVTCFRAINHHRMNRRFENSVVNAEILGRLAYPDPKTKRGEIRVIDRLQSTISKYLVLEISRNNVLVDALNYLWRRHPSELSKPLKVRMGMDEGEEGIDHGGVQQEFFRIAIAEALDPKYGK